jgi:multiple sugar transport system substrate-binding protein
MRRWGWIAIVAALGAAACSSGSSGLPANGGADAGTPPINTETPVTIAFLEHGNPSYGMANGVAFQAYQTAHPNVTIKVTTVEYATLTSTLLADLKNDRLAADLVQIPGNWICSFTANVADVPADVITMETAEATFFTAPLAGATCNGALKGLPIEYNLEYGGVVLNVDKYHEKFPGKTPSWVDWPTFINEAHTLA